MLITICKLYFNLKKVNKAKWKYLFSKDSAHGNKLPQDACKDKEKYIDHLLCVVCKNIGFQRKRHLLIGSVFSVDICVWSFLDSNHPKNTIPPNECHELYSPYIINAAAAAKSLQSCPTLCEPIDSSPPGSPVPGILQARMLEWVAISFSNAGK